MLGARLDRWIHGFIPVTAQGLALARILFASFLFLTGIPTFSWTSGNPPAFYNPPPISLTALGSGFPGVAVMGALDLLVGLLVVLVLVGWKTKAASILLSLAWIAGNSFRFSFGKIDHTIMIVVTPLVMAFSGWGACLSVDAKKARAAGAPEQPVRAWPLSLLALLLGFAFFSSGVPKLRVWADFDLTTQGARSWLVSGWYDLDRSKLLAPYFMGVSNALFWEVTDLVAVAFELGVLLSLVRRGLFRGFLFLAVMFHFTNLLMLNISFLGMLPVYATFAPWERVLGRLPSRLLAALDRLASTRGAVVLLVLLAPLYAWLLAGKVAADTAMLGFSHFGVLCGAFGVTDASWPTAVALFPVAILFTLYLGGLPQGQAIAAVPLPAGAERVLFFDGVCNLCNGFIDFLITRDRRRLLRYGSLQSDVGTAIDDASVRPGAPRVGSMVLVDADRRVYRSSDAVLKTVMVLGGAWRVLAILFLVPRPVREIVYRLIARYRYKLFGKKDTCRLPTQEERALFVS